MIKVICGLLAIIFFGLSYFIFSRTPFIGMKAALITLIIGALFFGVVFKD